MLTRRLLTTLPLALLALAATASMAPANNRQETMMQDDNHLIYATPAVRARTLNAMKSLGADRIRVTVPWYAVAPDVRSRHKPAGFHAGDPGSYPNGIWANYDNLLLAARRRGIGVDFNLTAPAPMWAIPRPLPKENLFRNVWQPSAKEFGLFVHAVARRYSGTYTPPGSAGPLPAVRYWSIWNEPNQATWLSPQSQKGAPVAPKLYRRYVDTAYAALGQTGHANDTLLIGSTAPKGSGSSGPYLGLRPMRFLRAVYCVNRGLHPLRGAAARRVGCPASGPPSTFASNHPGLFLWTGYAHHPYGLLEPPSFHTQEPDYVTLADLGRLTSFFGGVFRSYGVPRHSFPLYLDEYGYQTHPPDPYFHVSLGEQARWLNQADWLAYRNPNVRVLTQFLLYDDPPDHRFQPNQRPYWGTFQSGLAFRDHKHKPAWNAYRFPIWVPQRTLASGQPFTIWGLVRPAPNGSHPTAALRFRAHGAKKWTVLARKRAINGKGFITFKRAVPGSGDVSLAYQGAGARAGIVSRPVGLTVR